MLLMAKNDNPDLIWDKLVAAMKMAAGGGDGITIRFWLLVTRLLDRLQTRRVQV